MQKASILVLAAVLLACGAPDDPGPASFDIVEDPASIPGAVTATEAVRLLTETTLACRQVEDRDALRQWVCRADTSVGPGGARLTVSLLADGEVLKVIDAQAEAVEETGSVEGLASFFIETVIARLTPALATEPGVPAWVTTHIESAGSAEFAGSTTLIRLDGPVVQLQIYGSD